MNGQSYLCDRKNKPWVTSPNTEKANRKLTARNIAKPPCRRDPTSHSALVTAANSAVRLQGRGKDCRDADAVKSTVAYYLRPLRNDPEPRRAPLFGEATAVSVAPGSLTR